MTLKILLRAYKTKLNLQEWGVYYRSRLMGIRYSWNDAHSLECEINRKIIREWKKARAKRDRVKRYGGYSIRNNEPLSGSWNMEK